MTATVKFNVDQLIEVPAQAIAVHHLLKGTFDDEIARLQSLRDELAQRQAVDDTFEKAKAAHAEADAKRILAEQELANAKEWADTLRGQLREQQARIEAESKDSAEKAARTETARVVFESERKNATELMNQRSAALDLRESQLADMAARLGEEQRALAIEKQAFNRRLESLRVA